MKKQILIGLILFTSLLTLKAQTLYVPSGTSGIGTSTNGNVGIGTASPGMKLTTKSDYTAWTYFASINASPSDGSDGGLYLGSINTDNGIIGSGGTYYNSGKWMSKGSTLSAINFYGGSISFIGNTGLTANTEFNPSTRMTIASSGNVGIGTPNPGMRLTTKSDYTAWTYFASINASPSDGSEGGLYLGSISTDQSIIGSGGTYYNSGKWMSKGSTLSAISFSGGSISFISNTGLTANSEFNPSTKLTMQSNGSVLIGKTTQTNSTYKLDVAGKIRADEIVVNTTGADFVFEPTYKLRSLCEVETFIKQHKHLPDIAPATDMQTNGASLGEMQTKLLQKLEESTLYLIEQAKQIEALKKENQELRVEKDKQLAEQQQMLLEMKKRLDALEKMKKETSNNVLK